MRNLNIDRLFCILATAPSNVNKREQQKKSDRITLRFSQLFIAVGHSFRPENV